MRNIKVPEKYREDFKRALDKAVELGSFSDATLAEELNISRLNASILIGFMDKYEFLFPSAKNEVKAVRITPDEWSAIDGDIERYVPEPLEKERIFRLTPVATITALYKKSIEVASDGIMIKDSKTSMFIPAEETTLPHFRKAGLLKNGFIYFGEECPRNAREAKRSFQSLIFKKGQNEKFDALITSLIGDLEYKQ